MRTSLRLVVGVLAAGLVVSACSAPPKKVQASDVSLESSIPLDKNFDPEAEFNWSFPVGTTSWDPTLGSTGFDLPFLLPAYDRLVYLSPDGKFEPMLAESWDGSADGKVLTFKLRPNVTFSDGEPFNATAVKSNLDRAAGPGSMIKSQLQDVTSVEVIDDLTLKIQMDGGMGAFIAAMSERPGMMASPKAIAAGTLAAAPVGVGPYVASEIVPGNSVTFTKTEGYWDPDAQRVAVMHYKAIPDDQTRLNALQSGELNGAYIAQKHVTPAKDAGLDVIGDVSPVLNYLAVNSSVKPFDDPKVRLAMNYAIDRVGIGEGLFEGLCTPQIQPFPSTSFAYNKDIGDGLDIWPHDPEKAKELLKEAGYPDGFTFATVVTTVTAYVAEAEAIQDQLKEVGINMEIKPLPTVQLVDEFGISKVTPAVVTPTSSTVDPHTFMEGSMHPDARFNPGGQLSPEMVELIDKGAAPLDPKERAPFYSDFMDLWIEEVPHVMPICVQHITQAYDDTVSNVQIYHSGVIDLRGVAVSKKD